jgi:hypothetical protein
MSKSLKHLFDMFLQFGDLYCENAKILAGESERATSIAAYQLGLRQLVDTTGGVATLETVNPMLSSTPITDTAALVDASGIFEKIKMIVEEILKRFEGTPQLIGKILTVIDIIVDNITESIQGFEPLPTQNPDCKITATFIDFSVTDVEFEQIDRVKMTFFLKRPIPRPMIEGRFVNGRFTITNGSRDLGSRIERGKCRQPLVTTNIGVSVRLIRSDGTATFGGGGQLGRRIVCEDGVPVNFPISLTLFPAGNATVTVSLGASCIDSLQSEAI